MSPWTHAENVLQGANACKEHHSGITIEDVAEVIGAFEGCDHEWAGKPPCNTWCNRAGAAILRLKDGRIASVWECEDTTGHG